MWLTGIWIVVSIGITAYGQVAFWGECPALPTVENYTYSETAGIWYEHSRYTDLLLVGLRCCEYNTTDSGNNTLHVRVDCMGRGDVHFHNSYDMIEDEENGSIHLVNREHADSMWNMEYKILDTDYVGYMIFWGCLKPIEARNYQFVWVMTRSRTPEKALT